MRAEPSKKEQFERFLVRLIQNEGGDTGQPKSVRLFLGLLNFLSKGFGLIAKLRSYLYDKGILSTFPLGCQVISVGNVTAGGTGKTPVVEILARTLTNEGRKVAILSRGYRKKELPFLKRLFSKEPPRVVSDGKNVLLDSAMGGDEPFMLASNLPGVVVIVDKDRVKGGRYAIQKFGCNVLILDDGFQYRKLQHTRNIVLVDCTNPFGNGHLLPRGILRENKKNLSKGDYIFITKINPKKIDLVRQKVKILNGKAPIIECRHLPKYFKNLYTSEIIPLEGIANKNVLALSGIASPISFEGSIFSCGAHISESERFSDHYRYTQNDLDRIEEKAIELKLDCIITTEKDAVRLMNFPPTSIPIYYMRMEIEIVSGLENFQKCINDICFK